MSELDLSAIRDARRRMPPWIRTTPTLPGPLGSLLKCENLQTTGSYKIRAAFHLLSQLEDRRRARGAALTSSGNFAAAFAYAGRALGVPTTVVMMEKTSPHKVAATRRLGAEVVFCENRFEARFETLEQLSAERGLTSFNHLEHLGVIAGHSTVGLEFIEQMPDLGSILVPVSTAGLLAGVALAVKMINPRVHVVGVQPAGANAAVRSFRSGKVFQSPEVNTVCDALTATRPGGLPFLFMQKYVDDMVEVEDAVVLEAVKILAIESHLVAEPGGAAGLAALLSYPDRFPSPVGIVVSGGNISPTTLVKAAGVETSSVTRPVSAPPPL